jgi:hypothetical protein
MEARVNYPEPGWRYRHYKGGLYEFLFMSTHTETGEPMVVYRSLLFGTYFSRPLSTWNSPAIVDGKEIERFSAV